MIENKINEMRNKKNEVIKKENRSSQLYSKINMANKTLKILKVSLLYIYIQLYIFLKFKTKSFFKFTFKKMFNY